MKTIRDRAREQHPMVLLTLLSIVQALALELLWSYVRESGYLFEMSHAALLAWIQIATNLLGIIVIWLVYAGTAMRFRWIPTTSDSIYPFLVGALQFMLIETLRPEYLGWWFLCLGLIYALMTWVTHMQMRRARLDGGNDEFFSNVSPATTRDFYPVFVIVGCAFGSGLYLLASGDRGVFAVLAALVAVGVLVRQLLVTRTFWELTVADPPDSS